MAEPGNPNWTEGVSGNPNGRPKAGTSFIDRARYLMENFTVDEIAETVKDKVKFGKLSVYDGMVMKRINESIKSNGSGSMNSLLDRTMGKPPQYIEQAVSQVNYGSESERRIAAQKEAKDNLTRLAQRVGEHATKET